MALYPCGLCRTVSRDNVFVAVDAHSKWPEVLVMNSNTSQSTIEALRTLFGRYRLPKELVSTATAAPPTSPLSIVLASGGGTGGAGGGKR